MPLSDPRKSQITFRQLFTHTSGLCSEKEEPGGTTNLRYKWNGARAYKDWVVGRNKYADFTEIARLHRRPGTGGEHYSSIGLAHVGLIIPHITGISASRYLWSKLLNPIGVSGMRFRDAPKPGELDWITYGGLGQTPRDYARFGYLLLNNGTCNGKQIIPGDYLQNVMSGGTMANLRCNDTGYYDDLFGASYPKDMFTMTGRGANFQCVIPSHNLLWIRTSQANVPLKELWHESLDLMMAMLK